MLLKSEDSLVYWNCVMISGIVSFLKKQIKQKKKLLLKSLFILLLWFSFLPQQSYFSVNEVYATSADNKVKDDDVQKQRESLITINTFMQAISDIAFALLWPLVALAWLAMDNTLIYWSFMWLDVSLWNIWQMVRSFANYTLWFLFLAWILWYNLSWEDSLKVGGLKMKLSDLLKKVLISSVLIQASWFMMMVLVDLSTILTYSVWGIPYSILNKGTLWSWDDAKMFKMNVDLSLWDENSEVETLWDTSSIIKYYWHVTWSTYVAPCATVQVDVWWDTKQSFVLWREFDSIPDLKGQTKYNMIPWYCMYYWSLVSFNDIYQPRQSSDGKPETYYQTMNANKKAIESWGYDKVKELVDAWILFPLSNWKVPYLSGWVLNGNGKVKIKIDDKEFEVWVGSAPCDKKIWIVTSKKDNNKKDWLCLYHDSNIKVSDILQKAWSMTWPFAALYSSLSVYSNLQVWDKWLWQKFVITFVNVCFAGMLVLPLLALVVVLFARIWLLWVAIALSPFLVLTKVFDKAIELPDSLKSYLNFDELIKLLLAPVFVSFAVWISLIFMTVLKSSVWAWTDDPNAYLGETNTAEFKKNIADVTWMQISWTDLDLLWFIKIKLDSTMLNISWLLTMFFGLWVTWFLLFFAIKQTQVWKTIWQSLQGLWETFLTSTPIIPIGKNWLSINWLKTAPDTIFNEISRKREEKDNERLSSLLDFNKSDYEKQWSRFVRSSTISFNDAFDIQPSEYGNTAEMIKRMDSVYSSDGWWDRSREIASTYESMIQNAWSKEDLDKIVSHVNKHWEKRVELKDVTKEIWGVKYDVKKWQDGTYTLVKWGNLDNNPDNAGK